MAELSTAQLNTLKAAILADPALAPLSGGATVDRVALQTALNAFVSHTVWKVSVPTLRIGQVVNYVALAAMTTANLDRVKTFVVLNPETFDPSRSDIRTYMNDTFSGALGGQGQATRDALEAEYRRSARYFERVFATGIGSFASPATMAVSAEVNGEITVGNIIEMFP